jgi:membrane protein DedA with SNARE-associated domain
MRSDTIEKWVWVLIYAGLFAVAVGVAVQGTAGWLGSALIALGAALVVAGGTLIWVRSRMPSDRPNDKDPT